MPNDLESAVLNVGLTDVLTMLYREYAGNTEIDLSLDMYVLSRITDYTTEEQRTLLRIHKDNMQLPMYNDLKLPRT